MLKNVTTLTVIAASFAKAEWSHTKDGEIAYCRQGSYAAGACVSGSNEDCTGFGVTYANSLNCGCIGTCPTSSNAKDFRTGDDADISWKGGGSGQHQACLDLNQAIVASCTSTSLGKCTIPGGDGTTYNTVIGCANVGSLSYTSTQVNPDVTSYVPRIHMGWGEMHTCPPDASRGKTFIAELCSSGSDESCRGEGYNEYWGTIRCLWYV